ncbi:MAG: hypothetical protein ACLR1V_10955 [Coprococcus sp.]
MSSRCFTVGTRPGDQTKIRESYEALRAEGIGEVIGHGIWGILSPVNHPGGIFSGLLTGC